jgi:hypothetical protein
MDSVNAAFIFLNTFCIVTFFIGESHSAQTQCKLKYHSAYNASHFLSKGIESPGVYPFYAEATRKAVTQRMNQGGFPES